MKKELISFNELLRAYRTGESRDGHSNEANALEALVVLASRKYREFMSDIGSHDDQENKDTLCRAIQNDVAWEERNLF
jgi:hypothetical protein